MELIAVVDINWGIGYKGDLLFSLPPDLQHFKEITLGNVVVMGRKTAQSLPAGAVLKGRENIVLTRQADYIMPDAIVINSLQQLWDIMPQHADKKILVIGGADIYQQLIDYCDVAHVTKVNAIGVADSYLMNLDNSKYWQVISHNETMSCNGLDYTFMVYQRIKDAI